MTNEQLSFITLAHDQVQEFPESSQVMEQNRAAVYDTAPDNTATLEPL
jgi:hypothetical protein